MLALSACGNALKRDTAEHSQAAANDSMPAAGGVSDGQEPAREERDAQDPKQPGQGNVAGAVPAHPCRLQRGESLAFGPMRALGTEPFWAARIEGRCVTYMTPENQGGTRVWTQFSGTAQHGRWTGALGGRPFELRTRPEQDCSDGMSDKRYPMGATVMADGKEMRGCAERL